MVHSAIVSFNNPSRGQLRVKLSALIYVSFSVFLLSGCVQRPITPPYSQVVQEAQARGTTIPDAEEERKNFFKSDQEHNERLVALISKRSNDVLPQQEYRLGPGDEISLTVFDVPELNLTTLIKEGGSLSLPLIGIVQANGMTEEQLLREISGRLKSYVINPQVSLGITKYASQKVAVVGAVKEPGNYPLKKAANSILELISQAGGLTDRAGSTLSFVPGEATGLNTSSDPASRARLALAVTDNEPPQKQGIEIYLENIMGTSGNVPIEIPVRGGDMIIIPEAGKVMVDGEVAKVGVYELGSQASLLGALAAAGGITYGAKVDEVEIIRNDGQDSRHRLIVDLQKISSGEERDYKLRNGDIVKVPSDSGRRLRQDTFESISRLISFGVGGSVSMGP